MSGLRTRGQQRSLPARLMLECVETVIATVVVIATYPLIRHYSIPLVPLLLIQVATGVLQSETLQRRVGGADFSRLLNLRLGAHLAVGALSVYAVGGAPLLDAAVIVVVTFHLRWSGSRVIRPAMFWVVACYLVGDASLSLGWTGTPFVQASTWMIHLLTAVQVLIILFVIRQLGQAKVAEEAAISAMRRSEERHRTLLQHAADVVSVSDRRGKTTYVSSTVERVFGYTPEYMIGRNNSDMIHSDDLPIVAAANEALQADPSREQRFEIRSRHADGSWRWQEVTIRDLFGDPAVGGVVSNYRDVTDRKALEQRLRHLAFHDPLTGLANRGMFADCLASLVKHKPGDEYAVMVIDLDDFKTINDSLGHDVGDRLLMEVAEQLSAVIRQGDVLARLGGDEFALLIDNITDDHICAIVAERVAEAATRTFAYEGSVFPITASIGVARGDATIRHADELTRRADVAMYVSKSQGKARWTLFRPGMHLAGEERLFLRSALSQALTNDELDVHYQPIVDLSSGAICGMEALMRWRHPELGMVSPAEFIPVAEESGLIGPLGVWVLRRACQQIALWRRDYPTLTVSVNVAARQLRDATFPEIVRSTIDDAQLPPSALVLELTESSSLDEGLGTLRLLNELGVRLAIDDFGTGYSSLSYLQRLPIDVLKIDRSFVRDVDDVPRAAAIVDAIVRLGHALGVRLVAEGVEQTGQASALHLQGCQLAQGYLFAAPLDATAAENYLREHRDTGVPNIPSPRSAIDDQVSSVRPQ
jgi:diguanylate cyclase (GGDEF)-like protein/PAS domain S-box-containing protein